MKSAAIFFSKEEQKAIKDAIAEAETNTSGEIRVHIENSCPDDVMDRAAYIFAKLEMQKTQLRNGVLFILQFEIISSQFWAMPELMLKFQNLFGIIPKKKF